MIQKLRIKFIIINMVMITIMLCIIFGTVYFFTKENLENESINMLRNIVLTPRGPEIPSNRPHDLKLPFFTIQLNNQGVPIAIDEGFYDLTDPVLITELIQQTKDSKQETGILESYNLRFFQTRNPQGIILVFSDMSSEKNTLHNLMQTCFFIGTASFLLFLTISIFLSIWAIKPVEQAWKKQKQFVADASHELKTPLTVIITNAELLQDVSFEQEKQKQFVQSILIMAKQMKILVEKMLELARTDNQGTVLPMTSVNLSRLASDAFLSFEGIFFEKGLHLESFIEPECFIKGNESSLRQLFDILLDNAQKYSTDKGTVFLRLYRTNTHRCHLEIVNPGQALSAEDLQNIFHRFYRIDINRSRDGSFGLGLSIAENIVMQHNGTIWAESKNGFNTFHVEFSK